MTRLGKWATVVAGAFVMSSIAVTAQEQAGAGCTDADAIVQSSGRSARARTRRPACPAGQRSPAPPAAEPPAPLRRAPHRPRPSLRHRQRPIPDAAGSEIPAPTDPEPAEAPAEESPRCRRWRSSWRSTTRCRGGSSMRAPPRRTRDDPNRLVIAFHSGIDWTTWKATDFRGLHRGVQLRRGDGHDQLHGRGPKGLLHLPDHLHPGRTEARRSGPASPPAPRSGSWARSRRLSACSARRRR